MEIILIPFVLFLLLMLLALCPWLFLALAVPELVFGTLFPQGAPDYRRK